MRRRTPSVDNLIALVRKEERAPFPPRVQTIVSKSFVQQQNEVSREKGSGSKAEIKINSYS